MKASPTTSSTESTISLDVKIPSRLSWSSLSTYAECGTKWLLTRGHKVPQTTWFATIAGSAVHEITEFIDDATTKNISLENAACLAPSFKTMFDKLLAEEERVAFPSGRKGTKVSETGGPNRKDYDWWLEFGPKYVERWIEFRRISNWKIARMPDGRFGIELPFTIKLDDVTLMGFIDRVFLDEATGSLIVVDIKTGAFPAGHLQLGTYKLGMEMTYGLAPDYGVFWRPEDVEDGAGKLSQLVPMGDFDSEWLSSLYHQAQRGIEGGVFLPHVTGMCNGCTVRDYCRAVRGTKASELPVIPTILSRVDNSSEDVLV